MFETSGPQQWSQCWSALNLHFIKIPVEGASADSKMKSRDERPS